VGQTAWSVCRRADEGIGSGSGGPPNPPAYKIPSDLKAILSQGREARKEERVYFLAWRPMGLGVRPQVLR
jgi:hypothetical protein